MVNAAIATALDSLEKRAQDARSIFDPSVQPQYSDVVREARVEPARDPLAVVLPEGAYLLVGDSARPRYARNVPLAVKDGALVTGDGQAVLGFSEPGAGKMPQPLRVDGRDALLGRVADVRIEPDGVFGYARTLYDPQTLAARVERVVVGRLALARFPAGSQPAGQGHGAGNLRAPQGVAPHVGAPADGTFGALATHSRPQGAIDSDLAISRLGEAYVIAHALGGAERVRSSMARHAVELVK
ncbi:MAG: hypothetical protein JO101_08185 [Candidatus Eremiobacteraeota bacterium]|nr:hypothetical protein [Candidatus Eremiobacteraeota bacterium]MBV8355282.1 hypothetical protein [Candidatus Eremiobacteraeota bacterium]